jgi:hypothetical protein
LMCFIADIGRCTCQAISVFSGVCKFSSFQFHVNCGIFHMYFLTNMSDV